MPPGVPIWHAPCGVDREVVEDGNWVTSRQPGDLPAFNRAMLSLFTRSLVASHT